MIRTVLFARLIFMRLVVLIILFSSCYKTPVENNCSSGYYDCSDVCDGEYIIDNCDNCVPPGDRTCTTTCDSTEVNLPYEKNNLLNCDHVIQSFDICYGSDNESLSLDDYFGKIIWLEMVASW